MDSETLPASHLRAGQEYLEAVNELGLYPEFLGWAWDSAGGYWSLVMVTCIVEAGGPLALNELLFRAYRLHATPREISPFIVRVFGSTSIFAEELVHNLGREKRMWKPSGKEIGKGRLTRVTRHGLVVDMVNVYEVPQRKLTVERRLRDWRRFKLNVERLAA